jgi:2-methylisocitrate lyase-like PEP mutase family enzyme
MSSKITTFRKLHEKGELLVLPNVWDAGSASVVEKLGYPAVATSSAAVAGALGYGDGEEMSFDEYLFVIRRIVQSVQVPVTVDLEMGYGRTPEEIFSHVLVLTGLGVAGINLEDSRIDAGGRDLQDARVFAEKIAFLRRKLKEHDLDLFINVRCDTYLLNVPDARTETRYRMTWYADSGADGLFLPCIREEDAIADAVAHAGLPVNVMWVPGLPSPERLEALGVRRLSMGPYFYSHAYKGLEELAQTFLTHKMQTT